MSEETTNLATVARQEAERRRTLIALAIAGAALAFAVWWAVTNPFQPGPGLDASPTPSPVTTIAPLPQGEVTTAAGLPDALPLTGEVLARVESLWSLVTFRGDVVDDAGRAALAGPTILYLVSPTGQTYQVTNLDALGADALVAWDSARNVALLAFDEGASVRSYDMATGAVGPAIDPCDGGTPAYAALGTAGQENWRLYTQCIVPTGFVPYFHSTSVGDRGDLVWDNNLVHVPNNRTLKVSGDLHITSTNLDLEEFVAPTPTTVTSTRQWIEFNNVETEYLSPEIAPVCEIVGPGRNGTLAARCDNVRAGFIWELTPDSTKPERVLRRNQFPVDADGDMLTPTATCAAGDTLAVQWGQEAGTDGPLTLIQDGDPYSVAIDQLAATHCFGSSGTTMLIGGPEGLASLDTATGEVRHLIVSPTPAQLGLDPDQWVGGVTATVPPPMAGAEHQGVILVP